MCICKHEHSQPQLYDLLLLLWTSGTPTHRYGTGDIQKKNLSNNLISKVKCE